MREFVWLFEDRKIDVDKDSVFKEIGSLLQNYEQTKDKFYSTQGKFENYEFFLKYCNEKLNLNN